MLTSEEEETMERVCAKCGEYFGQHRAADSACPITEGPRTIGYHRNLRFVEWVDTDQSTSES